MECARCCSLAPATEIKPRARRLAALMFGVDQFNYAPRGSYRNRLTFPFVTKVSIPLLSLPDMAKRPYKIPQHSSRSPVNARPNELTASEAMRQVIYKYAKRFAILLAMTGENNPPIRYLTKQDIADIHRPEARQSRRFSVMEPVSSPS